MRRRKGADLQDCGIQHFPPETQPLAIAASDGISNVQQRCKQKQTPPSENCRHKNKTNFSMELLSLDEFQLLFLLRLFQNRGDDDGKRAAPPRRL
ncbi:uncharacterized protein HKW66_Vig0242270 [Vigna angularis]|uniref:Uncharacterized protein n=1 Tax=Phaseolus angularis TaxID=3914 RepID=A0A8T0JN02_PHAAN|nr:uncharacterized protein HKW66_Vig0242270 [Vigna angularis]